MYGSHGLESPAVLGLTIKKDYFSKLSDLLLIDMGNLYCAANVVH